MKFCADDAFSLPVFRLLLPSIAVPFSRVAHVAHTRALLTRAPLINCEEPSKLTRVRANEDVRERAFRAYEGGQVFTGGGPTTGGGSSALAIRAKSRPAIGVGDKGRQ